MQVVSQLLLLVVSLRMRRSAWSLQLLKGLVVSQRLKRIVTLRSLPPRWLLQQQTVDPQQQGVVVALPQQVVQAPAVLGPCTNHVLGRQLAGQAQIPTECNMISTSGDLDSFFTHMQSTLFSADQRGFQWLWYRASEECRQGRLSVFQCRTQANRTAVFSCPHCLQYTVAKYGRSNSERANLRMARWALLHWFTNPSMPVVPAEAQV